VNLLTDDEKMKQWVGWKALADRNKTGSIKDKLLLNQLRHGARGSILVDVLRLAKENEVVIDDAEKEKKPREGRQ
jgi:hypothetical protein